MLLALATGNLYPNDSETKKAVLEKYKEFIVPVRREKLFFFVDSIAFLSLFKFLLLEAYLIFYCK